MFSKSFTALAIAFLAASQVVVAQPATHHHGRRHAHGLISRAAEVASTESLDIALPESFEIEDEEKGLKARALTKPGIVYSPYNADRSCKSKQQVAADLAKIKDFSIIRLYGVDCNQIQNVLEASKSYGTKIMAGIYDMNKPAEELKQLIAAVGGQWGRIHTVAIGNEVVNFGVKDANTFAGIINSSRNTLRGAGYKGPVVGVDTFVAIMNNPAICAASDYVAANCHPFFDKNVAPEDSGKFLENMKKEMAKKCGNKKIMITETGWPTQGGSDKKAVPSVENQKKAIRSIVKSQGKDVILFTAFDDLWKTDTAATLNAEKHWGIKDLTLA